LGKYEKNLTIEEATDRNLEKKSCHVSTQDLKKRKKRHEE